MRNLIFLALLFILIGTGCKKTPYTTSSDHQIEIYLLKSYTKVAGTDAILVSSATLEESPLVNYEEILWYDPASYTFKIAEAPAKWLNDTQHNHTHGKAFAVTIDQTTLYTGYFWAGFSSASCNWITIDPLNYTGKNELRVNIGYPGPMTGVSIPDLRNDRELLALLAADKKLKQ